MITCIVCGKEFSTHVKIGNLDKNLGNRRRCLDCQPWKAPRYPVRTEAESRQANRDKSKRYYRKMSEKLGVNPVTLRNRTRKKALVQFLGGKCPICKYGRCVRNITFHHCFSKDRCLDSRSLDLMLPKIYKELKKCLMMCHICHGEIHDGLIAPETVMSKYKRFQKLVAMLKGKEWKDLVLRLGVEPSTRCL